VFVEFSRFRIATSERKARGEWLPCLHVMLRVIDDKFHHDVANLPAPMSGGELMASEKRRSKGRLRLPAGTT
jgi:hypothetical protein